MTLTEEILQTLIDFPTVSRDSNMALINFIEQYLNDLGIDCILTSNEEKTKTNLYAVLGPGKQGGVMLSGHTDVVPTEGQKWTVKPFEMSLKDGPVWQREH